MLKIITIIENKGIMKEIIIRKIKIIMIEIMLIIILRKTIIMIEIKVNIKINKLGHHQFKIKTEKETRKIKIMIDTIIKKIGIIH